MAEIRDAAGEQVYRSLSGVALAGLLISCLFGGVVAVSALMAIVQGAPFFFPNWVLFIALAGFLVSWWGINDIRNSEGTKAGQKLATCGMVISVVTGAGYFAYSYFTGVALKQQAVAFLLNLEDDSGFFPHLQKAAQDPIELNRAFLLTLPAPNRAGARPDDEAALIRNHDRSKSEGSPGDLTQFRTDPLVKNIVLGGASTTIEPLGVQSWKYENRSYHVTCLFRILTPEAEVSLAVPVRSTEPEGEGQIRQWFVDWTRRRDTLQLTQLGEGLKKMRIVANSYLYGLEEQIRKGNPIPPFAKLDCADWSRLEPAVQEHLKSRLTEIFKGDNGPTWHFRASMGTFTGDWERDKQGRLALTLPLTVMLMNESGSHPSSMVEAQATVRSIDQIDPVEVATTENFATPQWELLRFKVLRTRQPSLK
jgi:hypothetical protein